MLTGLHRLPLLCFFAIFTMDQFPRAAHDSEFRPDNKPRGVDMCTEGEFVVPPVNLEYPLFSSYVKMCLGLLICMTHRQSHLNVLTPNSSRWRSKHIASVFDVYISMHCAGSFFSSQLKCIL